MSYVLVITGSRLGHSAVERELERLVEDLGVPTSMLVGDAEGVDRQAREFAAAHDWPMAVFRADWTRYGKAAGPTRNETMVHSAWLRSGKGVFRVIVLAFPVGEARGTRDCMRRARAAGFEIYAYDETRYRCVRWEGEAA